MCVTDACIWVILCYYLCFDKGHVEATLLTIWIRIEPDVFT